MLQNENEAYAYVLCGHLNVMVHRLRLLPADKWDWTPAPPAPTARTLASHALQWLFCDRQHLAEINALRHPPVPEPPANPEALCDALAEETERWQALILAMTPEQFAEKRSQFNGSYPMNGRDFVCHMIQNCIYKHGQFSTLFFALGLDGDAPYDAPWPNPIYAELRAERL